MGSTLLEGRNSGRTRHLECTRNHTHTLESLQEEGENKDRIREKFSFGIHQEAERGVRGRGGENGSVFTVFLSLGHSTQHLQLKGDEAYFGSCF